MSSEVKTALAEALSKILGKGSEGSMAYIRCLESAVVRTLLEAPRLRVPGWEVYGVSSENSDGFIAADRAVELRENRTGNTLLLVDSDKAGPGMDGVFSAAREVRERELFGGAIRSAALKLNHASRKHIEDACKRARRIGGRRSISPWRQLAFYCACVAEPHFIGRLLPFLGLWPVEADGVPSEESLELSAQTVERLLLARGSDTTVQSRVGNLLLAPDAAEQAAQLEQFLVDNSGKPWTEVVQAVVDVPDLWINRLQPGFLARDLRTLQLMPWRKANGNPHSWTGLKWDDGSEALVFHAKKEDGSDGRLQVRWKTTPDDLTAGSVTYDVSILTGSDTELASKSVEHRGRSNENCVFTVDDLEEYAEDGGTWEAVIRVQLAGHDPAPDGEPDPLCATSERFVLTFSPGDVDPRLTATLGKKVRALVEDAVSLSEEDFAEACQSKCSEDRKGYVAYEGKHRSGRAFRPPLVARLEEDWSKRGYELGRWIVRVREDGSLSDVPSFVPMSDASWGSDNRKKVEDTTRLLARKAQDRRGFVGMIYRDARTAADYVNAWATALESGSPELALANTVEVQNQLGDTLGLVVLPSHAIRVAWHQAYDELAAYARFQEGQKQKQLVKELSTLDGSYFPAFLPGLEPGATFVFGDMLGFHAVAMVPGAAREPQALIALMARCLAPDGEDVAPSVGKATADALAREIRKYSDLHPDYRRLNIHALRPGDGLTVVRALGRALPGSQEQLEEEDQVSNALESYNLELYPSNEMSRSRVVGRHLSEAAERRRSGVGLSATEDSWMLDVSRRDGVSVPRLSWAKRLGGLPETPAHLAVAFDTFDSALTARPADSFADPRPLEAFGLFPSLLRTFHYEPVPTWETTVAPIVEGDKHPVNKSLSDRLGRIHAALLKATASNLGSPTGSWPVLSTEVTAEKADELRRLHELSDWVLTVDKNAGLEFFDAPKENPEVYDTYVIDCVPERHDLDTVQLVTSTSQVDEVMRLLNSALESMGLSCTPRNSAFLLQMLKAISGRLAMRLSRGGSATGELIALAVFYACCTRYNSEPIWPSPVEGFFVPLDDVRDLLFGASKEDGLSVTLGEDGPNTGGKFCRADLVYFDLHRRGQLRFTLVEVKYRRLLRSTREAQFLQQIRDQVSTTRRSLLDGYFSEHLTPVQRAIRRKRLARSLRFYADKASRHILDPQAYARIAGAIDKLYSTDAVIDAEGADDRGYVFCPEYTKDPVEIDYDGATRIILLGPGVLPDTVPPRPESLPASPPEEHQPFQGIAPLEAVVRPDTQTLEGAGQPAETDALEDDNSVVAPQPVSFPEAASLVLGEAEHSGRPVEWPISIKGNPHLMIVGLPGMGKTTCIVNLCAQLYRQGIVPLVFSYHQDIEAKLQAVVGQVETVDVESGIGFNPLRVVGRSVHAWIDNVGMLRDIFASIYPDFGELQTNEIREAIKQSYVEEGYGIPGMDVSALPVPKFQRFFDLLKSKPKTNPGILARLTELDDYGFFRTEAASSTLLEAKLPMVVRVHATHNEVLQNAMASFVLLNIYQNMFLRGEQSGLTHAVIFDEAHRASRLKLIPTMAKESRKFGISFVVSSQAAKDFNSMLYSAIANYLILRVVEADAAALAKNVVLSGTRPALLGSSSNYRNTARCFSAKEDNR